MRKVFSLFVLAMFSLQMSSANRSLSDMKKAAVSVLCPLSTRAERVVQGSEIALIKDFDQLVIMGNERLGFALVAKDSNFPAVLGYSHSKFNGLTGGLAWYVTAATQALKAPTENEAIIPSSFGYQESVEPFVETKWDQTEPYNNQCPTTSDGRHYITGCVATAMAQIMRYFKYPTMGFGTNTYGFTSPDEGGKGTNITVDFTNAKYNWSEMLNQYKNHEWNALQAEAVSQLMYHCGVAVSMQYSMNFSSAFSREAREALVKHFAYDSNANLFARDFFNAQDWMRMVYGELNAKRPIYYTGVDESSGGHAFVLCGYNAQGQVYVNWGWNGQDDGYYDIAILQPNGTSRSYAANQDMVVGISPTKVTQHESHICMDNPFIAKRLGTRLSLSGDKIINRGGTPFCGEIAVLMTNAEHQYVVCKTTIDSSSPIPTYERRDIAQLYGNFPIPAEAPDGQYFVYMASKDEQDADWRLIRHWNGVENNYNSAILTINAGTITLQPTTIATTINSIERTEEGFVRVYDLDGKLVLSSSSAQFTSSMLPCKGVFIVKQGLKSYKVIKQ